MARGSALFPFKMLTQHNSATTEDELFLAQPNVKSYDFKPCINTALKRAHL